MKTVEELRLMAAEYDVLSADLNISTAKREQNKRFARYCREMQIAKLEDTYPLPLVTE